MAAHVRRLCAEIGSRLSDVSVERFLELRNIRERRFLPDLHCDGYIEPRGDCFAEGFRMMVRHAPDTRMCFTVAHELCHTYFYELVPEIKFSPHDVDNREEQLCNYGAVCLLMPEDEVCSRAEFLPIGISSLEDIACAYAVSLDTAVLRLRSLKLWNCEFFAWRRMTTGECVMDRLYGYERAEWRWANEELLQPLWSDEEGTIKTGRTFVEFDIPHAHPAAKPVFYQAKRRGNVIVALWRARPFPQAQLPLLGNAPARRRRRRAENVSGGRKLS
jgi:IrrE N-terminal-like domain